MKYKDGSEIQLYDIINYDGAVGVVLVIVDDDLYSKDYPREEWSYLKKGILIDTELYGLIYYSEMPEYISLITRKDQNL